MNVSICLSGLCPLRCQAHLSQPAIELPDLGGMSGPGEVSSVHENIAVRYRNVDVRGEGVSVRHAHEPQLNIPELAER